MHMSGWKRAWASAGLWLGLHGTAYADEGPQSYALVVGENRGGPGQHTLAFAERDAERMGALLGELGRVPREHLRVLKAPSVTELRAALAALRAELAAQAAAGARTQLVFYYSGHARAQALSLGDDELPLDEVRAALTDLPSTLTIVVLDACQSGAFSGVKGARPSQDFSAVSVSALRSAGFAVMASSTAAELSQESQELEAGYFTHHLAVGLRGAGDVDRDGRVSLDEAYRYAYAQTLAATARTRVGMQHATLETAIAGRGDVPLTYPADADAQLVLAPETRGRVLVELPGHGAVVAELVKVAGSELSLALPHGRYEVLLREDGADLARACTLELAQGASTRLDERACRALRLDADTHKKAGREPFERWFAELGLRYTHFAPDAYTRTLESFGYASSDASRSAGLQLARRLRLSAAAGLGLHPHVSVLVRYDGLDGDSYDSGESLPESSLSSARSFWYRSQAVMLGARLRLPLRDELVVPFAELAGGLGFARTVLTVNEAEHGERKRNLALRAALGAALGRKLAGGYVALGFSYAPVLVNRFGEHHQVGGPFVEVGVRFHRIGRK